MSLGVCGQSEQYLVWLGLGCYTSYPHRPYFHLLRFRVYRETTSVSLRIEESFVFLLPLTDPTSNFWQYGVFMGTTIYPLGVEEMSANILPLSP